ncbi:MmgE/PrpD family protein, partial [Bacteroides thetaiotaomicron]
MKKYTQILADYLADLKYENIPAEVIERAKMVTLHTVGVALGAAKAKTVREAIEVAKGMGESERGAPIFGDGSKVSVTSAAFA